MPTPFVPLAMFGWLLAAPALFALVRPRWALIASFAIAWMFLPQYTYDLSGLPPLSKMSVTAYGALLGVLVFDPKRLLAVRPSLIDLPMVIWCVVPFFSVLANGPLSPSDAPEVYFWNQHSLGPYDAFSKMWEQTISWGVPYLLGRAYLGSGESHRDAMVGLFVAGLVYIPFCLFEARMSPQLHRMVYGFAQHSFGQTIRFDGYRPMVFMEHGLMVAFWMATATIAGFHLWVTGSVRRVRGVSTIWALGPLFVTALLCRSLGAWVQMSVGVAVVAFQRRIRLPMLIASLALIPPVYITARVALGWDGGRAYQLVRHISEERAQSLAFRLKNEDILVAKALKRPLLGWAGWDRNRVFDEYGKDVSVTDGRWVLAIGEFGLVGLVSLFGWLLLPAALALVRLSSVWATSAHRESTAVCALIVLLFAIDAIPNAMENPYYMLLAGGLATFAITRRHPAEGAA